MAKPVSATTPLRVVVNSEHDRRGRPRFSGEEKRCVLAWDEARTNRGQLAALSISVLMAFGVCILQACGDEHPVPSPSPNDAAGVATMPTQADSAQPSSGMAASQTSTAADGTQDFAVILRDVVRIPASGDTPPLARINFLFHAGDRSGRLFVSDMRGRIYVIKDGKVLSEPFLDMARTRGTAFTSRDLFEQGLSTFAFHPDFAKPDRPGFGKFYTSSTEMPDSRRPDFPSPDPSGRVSHLDVLTEWGVDPHDPNRIDPASRREVLRIAHPLHDHVMGQVAFNPTANPSDRDYGMLYIALGDGGNTWAAHKTVDAWRSAQNKTNPFGKLLRINPLGSGYDKYTVPADNPFVRSSGLREIWAMGLRNPQRFSWDTGGDHKMIIADVGQAEVEEINVGTAGANYGWSEREGTWVVNHDDVHQLSELPPNDATFGFTYPAAQYRHDVGRAITGGFVYRGRLVPALRGTYVFGDIVTGKVFCVPAAELVNGRPAALHELELHYYGRHGSLHDILEGDGRLDLRFGTDEQGEIYLLTQRDSMIRKLSMSVPAASSGQRNSARPTP